MDIHSIWGIDRLSLSVLTLDHCERDAKGRSMLPSGYDNVKRGPWDGLSRHRMNGSELEGYALYVKALPVGKGTVNVRLSRVFTTTYPRFWLLLDWNPSRQLYGSTGELARLGDLPGLIAAVQIAVKHLVTVSDWELARVTRVDATVDFRSQVSDSGERAGTNPVDRRAEVEEHSDCWPQAGPPGGFAGLVALLLRRFAAGADRVIRGKSGAVETCYWNGPGAQHVIAYDKGAQRGELGGDWLRTEVVCRKLWLRAAGISTIGTLTADTLDRCARAPWEATKMSEQIETTGELQRALDGLGLSGAQRRGLLGWLVEDRQGWVAAGEGSRTTLAKYRRWQRQLGPISDGVWAELLGVYEWPRMTARLDLDSGTIVVARAS
jgi:hypothetical protein